ncbi:MAG: alpha-amylase family protein [Rikenellaceae bacterium]
MGYILSNEPHWHSIENTWATGDISNYTKDKFRVWLQERHSDIKTLNELWGTSFASFDDVDIVVPIAKSVIYTPMGYDWQRFNMDRSTDWFRFLDSSLKKYDPEAKTHIKLIPRQFINEYHDHGLDMEALFEITDIVGNDAKIIKKSYFKNYVEEWEKRYAFDWSNMSLPYDFFHSVDPDGPNVNSENHFLSSTSYRDIYLSKEFTRTSYWLATLHGMDISYTWFWPREKDGEIRKDLQHHKVQFDNAMNSAYVASVVQQPRVANEVTKTYMELNAFAEEIAQMQALPRPIRIFYSETSAITQQGHLDDIHKLYEKLYFEGAQLGFVTKNILTKQDDSLWDVILIKDTEHVTESEIDAIQAYIDRGGKVIIDEKSLKYDPYNRVHTKKLKQTKGKLVVVEQLQEYFDYAFKYAQSKNLPEVIVDEQNSIGEKGCLWRSIKMDNGNYLISITNMGKSDATVTIGLKKGKVKLLTEQFLGQKLENGFTIPSEITMLIEITN